MFGLTEKDADNIASGISSCPKLRLISVRNSKVTDTLLYDVMGGIDKLVNVSHLDFPGASKGDMPDSLVVSSIGLPRLSRKFVMISFLFMLSKGKRKEKGENS